MKKSIIFLLSLVCNMAFANGDFKEKITNLHKLEVAQLNGNDINILVNEADFLETLNYHLVKEGKGFNKVQIIKTPFGGQMFYYAYLSSSTNNKNLVVALEAHYDKLRLKPLNADGALKFLSCEGMCEPQLVGADDNSNPEFICESIKSVDKSTAEKFPCYKTETLWQRK